MNRKWSLLENICETKQKEVFFSNLNVMTILKMELYALSRLSNEIMSDVLQFRLIFIQKTLQQQQQQQQQQQ